MIFKKIKRFLPLLGFVILVYLLRRIGIKTLISSIVNVNIYYLVISFLFSFLILFLQAYKWKILLKGQNISLGNSKLFYIFMQGWVYGLLTPGRLGSFLRISYLKDETHKSLGVCSSNVIIDRIFDTVALLILAGIGSLLLITYSSDIALVTLGVLAVSILLLIIFISKKRTAFILRFFFNFFMPNHIKEKSKQAFNEFYDNTPTIKSMVYSFLITMVSWVLIYVQAYIIALAFSVNISLVYFITIYPIATIVGLIPITIGGFGTREAALVTLFYPLGVAAEKIVSISLVSAVLSVYFPAILLSFFLFKRRNKTK